MSLHYCHLAEVIGLPSSDLRLALPSQYSKGNSTSGQEIRKSSTFSHASAHAGRCGWCAGGEFKDLYLFLFFICVCVCWGGAVQHPTNVVVSGQHCGVGPLLLFDFRLSPYCFCAAGKARLAGSKSVCVLLTLLPSAIVASLLPLPLCGCWGFELWSSIRLPEKAPLTN